MKKILFLIFVFFIFCHSIILAQNTKEEKTEKASTTLEKFFTKKGNLIIKDFYRLGDISCKYGGKMELNAIVVYEPHQENQKIKGFKIEISKEESYGENSNISFLDFDESKSLSDAVGYMISLIEKWKDINKEYTEVIFSTKGDFQIGFYQEGVKQGFFSSSGYIGKVWCSFSSIQDLTSVKNMVDKGLQLLTKK
jgi:hypothetical protein